MTSRARQATKARRTRFAVCGALAAGTMLAAASPAAADPGVSEPIADVASHRWNGTASTTSLAQDAMDNVGDINGDGRDDILASARNPSPDGVHVLFSPPGGGTDIDNLAPDEGYTVLLADTSPNGIGIGDQNDDGIPDLLVITDSGDEAAVVYGIEDPSSLPACPPPRTSHCLDLTTPGSLTSDQGYYITSSDASLANLDAVFAAADFNGDGVNEMAFGAANGPEVRGAVYVVFGGRDATLGAVELETMSAADGFRIDGPAVDSRFGFGTVSSVGDLNGDGRDEISIENQLGAEPPGTFVIYGVESPANPTTTETFGPAQGFRLAPAPGLSRLAPGKGGDVNGDGRDDLVVGSAAILLPPVRISVIYSPSPAPADPIAPHNPDPGQGYVAAIGEAGEFPLFDEPPFTVGDLDGDGVPDFLSGNRSAPVGGRDNSGMAVIVFGRHPAPSSPAVFDASLTPEQGFALTGNPGDGVGEAVGERYAAAGDVDEDGLPDFFVSASNTDPGGFLNAGSVYLVLGKDLVGESTTGQAGQVTTSSASLGGSTKANGRPSEAYFEYGTSEQLGQTTSPQDIGGGNTTQSIDADVSGLQPDTTYHYRAVVENDLGLKRYGNVRTFTTDATPTPANGGGGGGGGGGGAEPGLDVTANPPSKKVKAKKRARFTAAVRNTGGAPAQGVQLCVESSKTGKKGLNGTGCESIGALGANSSTESTFGLKPMKKAKGKHRLTFTATAEGVSDSTDTADLQVKKKKKKKKK